ncbi:MAG: immunoglobulin-like domain-containing protein [Dysgonomonas sp.]|nr:immunoglobulin-like domain-containing protein [Dysgonomonas sp.]
MKTNNFFYLVVLFILIAVGCTKKNTTPQVSDINNSPISSFVMELTNDTLASDAKFIEGTVMNNTSYEVEFGEDFKLQVYKDSLWEDVVPKEPVLVHSLAYIVRAKGSASFKHPLLAEFRDYELGKYRILKNLSLTLETDFHVTDTLFPEESKSTPASSEAEDFYIQMSRDTLPVTSDMLTFTVGNYSTVDIFPLEHYFLLKYDEKEDNWLDFYHPAYDSEPKRKLAAGETTKFEILFNQKKIFRYKGGVHIGKDFLSPGKFRIRKYVEIPISYEFTLIKK